MKTLWKSLKTKVSQQKGSMDNASQKVHEENHSVNEIWYGKWWLKQSQWSLWSDL